MAHLFKNTGLLTRFILKRDRFRICIWVLAITIVTLVTAHSFTGLYQSPEERQAMAETMKNPAMIALVGQGYGIENYTNGAMLAHQMLLFTAITVGVMSVLLVTRHTRRDEEDGMLEMLRALPTGRLTNLTSTILVYSVVYTLLALLVGFGLWMLSIESIDLEGSLIYGAALGATGIFFTATTATIAQMTESSRGTIGCSIALVIIFYIIRAVGDVSNESLSLFSPLGWILSTEAYVHNYWWPIFVTVLISIIIVMIGYYLNVNRDVGYGLLPTRKGRSHASIFLQGPVGLAYRLLKTSLLSWGIGLFIIGVSYGSVFGDLELFIENNDMLKEFFASNSKYSLTEQFLTMLMTIMSIFSTVPALVAIFKLKGEEKKGRLDHLFSKPLSRTRLMGAYLSIAFIVTIVMQLLTVLSLWLTGNAVMVEPISLMVMLKASFVYLPALWTMIGLAVLLVGYFPSFTGIAWGYLIYSFFVVYMGELIGFPKWLSSISPFGLTPRIPVEDMNVIVVIVLTIVAIILSLIGFKGYRQRDLQS